MRALVCDVSLPREAFLACGEQQASGAVKVLFTYPHDGPEAARN